LIVRAEQKREDKSVLIASNALMLMLRIYTLHKLVIKPSLLSTDNKLLRQMKDEATAAYRFSTLVVFFICEIYEKKNQAKFIDQNESSLKCSRKTDANLKASNLKNIFLNSNESVLITLN
jgi:hypothetical protein